MTSANQRQELSHSDSAALSNGTPQEQRAADANRLAHDARNWLTVLQVYCDLLRSSGAVARHGRAWIEELSNAVARGQGLVTALLHSAQSAAAQEPSSAELTAREPLTLDLSAAIQKLEPLLRRMAGSTIHVESHIAVRAETKALHELDFDRILLNLVRNGIEAMPRGGRLTLELEHGVSSGPRHVVLRVSDTGQGISADALPHIFDSGFSTKSAAQHPKVERGFGLAIVRELTLAAGGSVRVRSLLGQRTCFTVELPLQPPAATVRSTVLRPKGMAPGPQTASQTPSRPLQPGNFGPHRKGTRVPC